MNRNIVELKAIKVKTIYGSIITGIILEDKKVSLLYMNNNLYNLVNGKVRSKIDNDIIGVIVDEN